jgi:hypothetical protein
MVKKMSTEEFFAWRCLYTGRLKCLRSLVIQTMRDAREGNLEEDIKEKIVSEINDEVNEIIKCGVLLNDIMYAQE